MDRNTTFKIVVPVIVALIVVISFLIMTGLASGNPDGFEWALFDWAGIHEPEGGFAGIFSFLGEGPLVDAVTGGIGIIAILIIVYLFFKFTSRKAQ